MLTFEVSPDGIAWTMIAQKPTPFVSSSYLDVFAGTLTSQAGPLGSAAFDNCSTASRHDVKHGSLSPPRHEPRPGRSLDRRARRTTASALLSVARSAAAATCSGCFR